MLVAKRNNLIEMKVKYSRFRHNAKQTSFTSPTGPRRQGGEHEHAQYPKNDDVTSGWSCRRPENVSILSSLFIFSHTRDFAFTPLQNMSGLRRFQFNLQAFDKNVHSHGRYGLKKF